MTANIHTVCVFGIKNCNTMQKVFSYFAAHQIAYQFHDYKKQGIDESHLQTWCKEHGWEKIINRAGVTFKKLPADQKLNLTKAKAIALMIAQPTMIKRPIVELANKTLVGFKIEEYDQIFIDKIQ